MAFLDENGNRTRSGNKPRQAGAIDIGPLDIAALLLARALLLSEHRLRQRRRACFLPGQRPSTRTASRAG